MYRKVFMFLKLNHDVKCVDLGRLFFKSKDIISSNFNGKCFIPLDNCR